VDTTEKFPTLLSFCSGYGGIERGLELAGVNHRVLAYVEIEAFAIANLLAKMEEGKLAPAPIWTDIKTFPAHLFRGCVDVITGGYPCQPFSTAGKRQGKNDSQGRHLWPYIREYIRTIKPAQCFFENVEGHVSLGLSSVISDLEEDGYDPAFGIFSAAEVGAPHQRKRVFIMAHSISERSQRYSGGMDVRCKESRRDSEEAERSTSSKSLPCRKSIPKDWSSEPDICRVVDGCADRVDRIKLLGNGVVPQTACKAWKVLNNRLSMEK